MRFEWRNSKRLIIFVVLRAAIVFCMARQLLRGAYHNVLLCILSLAIMSIPALLHAKLRLRLPNILEISIAAFVFAAEILGEIANFYGQLPFWDTMLHTINGFLAAAIGFNVVDLLNTHAKGVKLAPFFVALVSFCFSMTVGVLWEFFEFGGDRLAGMDMQKDRIIQSVSSVTFDPEGANNAVTVQGIDHTILYDSGGQVLMVIEGGYLDIGIIDTMKDLMVNMAGALVFSALGYLYIFRRDQYRFAESFLIVREPVQAPGPE